MANHDSRWSDRRNVRQEDHRVHEYAKRDQPSRQVHYDHYDPYDSTGEGEYGSREYPDGYEQPTDLYENVPAARNIARIQITADEVEERRPQQRYRQDYDQHTIDRPYKGGNNQGGGEPRRDERKMESQRRAEIEKNAEKSRQQAENRRREEVEKARRAELEREEEKRRVEAERQRQMEERKRQEQLRKQQQQQQQQPREQSQQRREPHLRYEPSPVPFHGQKQGIIDGFQSSPNKQKIINDYREEDYRPQAKKTDIPPPPPAPKSIKAIINNLKGNVQEAQKAYKADDGRNDIPRNKVSTNPFIRAGDKAPPSPARTPDQPIKNVQEVVQKMNSGEWPIRVEEEEARHKLQQFKEREPSRPRSQPSFDQPKQGGGQKARQWEELDRVQSPDHRQNERRGSHSEVPQRRERDSSVRDLVREADEEQRRHESEFSERSENGEITTVSTDSAMGSDGSVSVDDTLPFELPHGTVIRKLPGNVKELNEEAEKLLLYFKGHRSVLNYLGIGLSETLWTHIHALPEANAEIIVEIPRAMPVSHSPKKAPPQITVTQPAFSPKPHREQPSRSPDRRHPKEQPPAAQQKSQPSRPSQSPRMTALERQLCTDMVSPLPPAFDEQPPRNDARSGRFVKKSAAALIARRQGAILHSDDEPLPSDFVDSRIAAEIEQLRAREEELRRSRSQLGLPTIDDVMDGWRGNQQYFDYQKQMPIARSQSAHSIYHDNRPSPNIQYVPSQKDDYEENVTARVQRMKEFEQKFERGEQFFRSSETQLRQRSAISRMDITVLSPGRASSPPRRGGPIGL